MSNHVLLLHGQPGLAHDWDRVIAALGDDFQPLAIDRPGWNGHSRAHGLAGNAAAAVRALDSAGVTQAIVVGHSFGAAVAAWMASAYPDRVAALVLAAPSANRASLVWLDHLLAAPGLGYIAGIATLGGAGYALAVGGVRRAVGRRLGLEERYLDAVGRKLRAPGAWRSFSLEQRALIAELPELERRLAAIAAPTTVVAGTHDVIVPFSSAKQLVGQIPGAELVAVRNAGHLLSTRHPARLASAITAAGAVSGVSMD